MKYTVLMRILFMLLAKKKVTAKEISDKFEISKRTVYRYMDELSLAHVPIMVERGQNGGFYIADSFKLPCSYLTQEEYDKLSALVSAFSETFRDDEEVNALKEKLFLSVKSARATSPVASPILIDSSNWNDYGGHSEKINIATEAINESKTLKISYHDRNGEVSKRVIEPHALILKQGLWYLFAYCRTREDFRLFKISRIEYAHFGEAFSKRLFDAKNLPFNEWYSSIEREEVELIVDESVKSDVEEWLGIDCVSVSPSGRITASCSLPYDKGLVSEIMKYGKKITVVKPEKLKRDIAENAKELLKLYEN